MTIIGNFLEYLLINQFKLSFHLISNLPLNFVLFLLKNYHLSPSCQVLENMSFQGSLNHLSSRSGLSQQNSFSFTLYFYISIFYSFSILFYSIPVHLLRLFNKYQMPVHLLRLSNIKQSMKVNEQQNSSESRDPIEVVKEWYLHEPKLTRYYILCSLMIGILCSIGLIDMYSLYFQPSKALKQLQLWRVFTSFLYQGKLSYSLIFELYFVHFVLSKLQRQVFEDKYSDFIWLVIICSTALLVLGTLMNIYIFSDSLIMALVYILCKRKSLQVLQLVKIEVQYMYVSWLYFSFKVLMGSSILVNVLGLGVGSIYILVKDLMFIKYGKDQFKTPQVFANAVNRYYFSEQGRRQILICTNRNPNSTRFNK